MYDFNHAGWDWEYNIAALRSQQAFLGSITGTAVTTVYTVPAGKRFIIKFVSVQNTSGSAVDFQLRLSTLGTVWHWNLAAYGSGGDRATQNLWVVLNPGDTIAFKNSVSVQVDVTVSGSLHTI